MKWVQLNPLIHKACRGVLLSCTHCTHHFCIFFHAHTRKAGKQRAALGSPWILLAGLLVILWAAGLIGQHSLGQQVNPRLGSHAG